MATQDRPATVIRLVALSPEPAALAAAAATLSPAELARAERGVGEVYARRVLLRAALRRLLGELLEVAPPEVPLAARPGRPALDPRRGAGDLDMSCSASGDIGLVAIVRGGRIGIDVQTVLPEDADVALREGWLSVGEHHRISRLPAAERPAALTWAWVQKEAVLKGQGVGLRADPAAVRSVPSTSGRIGRWNIWSVDVPPGHVAGVAVRMTTLASRLTPRPPVVA